MIELGDLINEFVHLTLVLFYFKDMVNWIPHQILIYIKVHLLQ